MKPTKENINILKKLGFKVYQDSYGVWECELDNGWSISLNYIKSFKRLIKRLYVGQADKNTSVATRKLLRKTLDQIKKKINGIKKSRRLVCR